MNQEDVKFLNFISFWEQDDLEKELDNWYNNIKKNLNINKTFGFRWNGVKELAGAILLSLPYKDLQEEILIAIVHVLTGYMSPLGFSDYMDNIVRKSPISEKAWHDTYNYLDKNHKWLESHIFAKGEI